MGQGNCAFPSVVGNRLYWNRHCDHRPDGLRDGTSPGAAVVPQQRVPPLLHPAAASIVVGVVLIAATWIYLLSSSISNVFTQLIDVTGLLYAAFYVLTTIAAMVYYRHRIISNPWDAVLVGILPIAAAGFLVWILVKSLQAAPASQIWSLVGIVGVGFILMFVARFVLRSPFFQIPRESAPRAR